jgi:hypothetical protein
VTTYPIVPEGPAVDQFGNAMTGAFTIPSFVPTEGLPFFGMAIDRHLVLGPMPSPLLQQVTYDPRKIEDPRALEYDPSLRDVAELHKEVQRLFEGVKKKNVGPYARYIVELYRGERTMGITPPIFLFTPKRLKVTDVGMGLSIVTIPFGERLVAIDGETQLAARFEAWEIEPGLRNGSIPVAIAHGYPAKWGRQAFHDLNTYGSKPNPAIAISMDQYDAATAIARRLEEEVDFLRNRVNHRRRQLRKSDRAQGEIMTVTALRGSVVTLARGISGVAFGSKGVEIDNSEKVTQAAIAWWEALAEHLGDEITDADSVASAPATIAALGAVGHDLVERFDELAAAALDEAAENRARDLAEEVDWSREAHWSGIAGKFTPKGRFAIGGAKETSYLIYNALTDKTTPGYKQIRKQ